MKHILFADQQNGYPIAILIKEAALNKTKLINHYITPLKQNGVMPEEIMAFSITDTSTVKEVKTCLEELAKPLAALQTKLLYVTDGTYFKALTGVKKVTPYFGYVMDCTLPGYENCKAILGVNYTSLFHNPDGILKINQGLAALADKHLNRYVAPGTGVIQKEYYPRTVTEILEALKSLHKYPRIACDIETFSLKHYSAGIGTIAFATSNSEGFAFTVDYQSLPFTETKGASLGKQTKNVLLKSLLIDFFIEYTGIVIYHGATFDAKILAFELMQDDRFNYTYKDQLEYVKIMTKNIACTKILTYLATNNCIKNTLSLKENAQEYFGNWAEENIDDITKIHLPKLLKYNLTDAMAAFYLYEKYIPIVIRDNQLNIYQELFLPFLPVVINTELNGMCMDRATIEKHDEALDKIERLERLFIECEPLIQRFTKVLRYAAWMEKNLSLKKKVMAIEEFDHIEFNPASNQQLQHLLFTEWKLPIIDYTDGGAPATGGDVLEALLAYLENKPDYPERKQQYEIIKSLLELAQVSKIKNTFFKAFKEGKKVDIFAFLHGNFNATGTKSGRLSSSDPNLQNLPATGSKYAKMVKECFVAPMGWLMVGADFDSLEDKISALQTKDPNKLKVYTDGYDGHCLRAFSYFPDRISGIDPTSVSSINSIAKLFPSERQDSKGPTFLLTYGGTHHGMMKQFGLTKEVSQQIEANYHELYKASDEWVAAKVKEASKKGYVEVAFGLRLRTPLLARTDLGKSYTPYEAQKEARTAGNALGQSYCMLNNRAAIEFMDRVDKSPYRLDIKMICLIHDAIYLIVRDDLDVVHWVNTNLPDCMSWQNLPDIQHPTVKLSGSLDIFYPSWANPIGIPKGATKEEIQTICRNAIT